MPCIWLTKKPTNKCRLLVSLALVHGMRPQLAHAFESKKKTMASGDATPSRQLFWTLVNLFQPLRSALSVWLSNYRRQRNGSSHVVIATNSRFTASDSCVGQISAKICAMTIVKVIAVGNCLTPAGRKTIYFVYEFRCIAFAHRKLFSWSL